MNPILEEIKPETAEQLAAQAKERGLSVDECLRSLLPPPNGQPEDEERSLAERLEGIIGGIDSNVPDPNAKPHHTPFGALVAEKLKKQGLRIP